MPDTDDRMNRVQTTITELTTLTARLTGNQAEQIRKMRRAVVLTVVGLVLDLFLTVGGAVLVVQEAANSDRIVAVQKRTSNEAFCPLYSRLLDSYNKDSATAKLDPAAYERSIVAIESGARALGCSHAKRGIEH
jgi:hypothetical protein